MMVNTVLLKYRNDTKFFNVYIPIAWFLFYLLSRVPGADLFLSSTHSPWNPAVTRDFDKEGLRCALQELFIPDIRSPVKRFLTKSIGRLIGPILFPTNFSIWELALKIDWGWLERNWHWKYYKYVIMILYNSQQFFNCGQIKRKVICSLLNAAIHLMRVSNRMASNLKACGYKRPLSCKLQLTTSLV